MRWVKPYQYSILLIELARHMVRRTLRVRQRSNRRALGPICVLGFLYWSLWASQASSAGPVDTVRVDWAYYNPISLVLKNKHWLQDDLGSSSINVEWVQSLGGNKALEFLRGKYRFRFDGGSSGVHRTGQWQPDQSNLRLLCA